MHLILATRRSPLALAQAEIVRTALTARGVSCRLHPLRSSGDKTLDRPLADIGGKGLFTKELDQAVLDGRAHAAVHSMKDMETTLPDGLALTAVLPRGDVRDALIGPWSTIDALPHGAVVGTASLRRQAQLLRRRSDLRVTMLRGNLQTRLARLGHGTIDATVLAMAGLARMGLLESVAATALAPEAFLPAVAQGAIALVCRTTDDAVQAQLAPLDHPPSATRVKAERALLAALDGSCRTPIAGLAQFRADGALWLRGLAASADGVTVRQAERIGDAADAERLGRDAGQELRHRMGSALPR